MVRVVLVTHYFGTHRGGVERVAGELAMRLAATGRYAIAWIASDCDPLPAPTAWTEHIGVGAWNGLERIGFPWPIWGPRGIARLKRAIADADVVHIHDFIYFGNIAAFVLARRARKPVVVTQHIGDIPFRNPLLSLMIRTINRTLGRWVLGNADRVLFISDAVRFYFAAFVDFREPPAHVPNGVDTRVFYPRDANARQLTRAALGIAAGERVILYVGRFVDKKGLPLLGRLARALPQYRWWFAGWGEPGAAADPASWGLPHVRVFGDRSGATLAELYCASNLLVLASMSEGFPLVVQEAMACGTPVLIAERIADGAPEAAAHLRTAPIEPDDTAVGAWTASIADTLDEEADRSRARERVEFARSRWAWEATVARYDEVFASLTRPAPICSTPPPPPAVPPGPPLTRSAPTPPGAG